jgi:hypothetical protein
MPHLFRALHYNAPLRRCFAFLGFAFHYQYHAFQHLTLHLQHVTTLRGTLPMLYNTSLLRCSTTLHFANALHYFTPPALYHT